jgi:hypothetical protein
LPWSYSRGRKFWRQGLITPYEFQDEFTIADVNPLVTPRLAEPGPGMWNVVDLDGRLAVNLNQLAITGGGSAAWDRTYLENPQPWARKAGRLLEFKYAPISAGNARIGWQSAPGGLVASNLAMLQYENSGPYLQVRDEQGTIPVNFPTAAGASGQLCRIYDTGTEFLFFVADPLVSSHYFYPLWRKTSTRSGRADIYHAIQNYDQQFTMDYLRIREGWLPKPTAHLVDPAAGQLALCGADGYCEVQVTTPASGTAELRFRYQDSLNYWRAELNIAGSTLKLVKKIAGTDTTLGTTAVTWTTGEPVTLKAVFFGTAIRIFYGRLAGTATTSANLQSAALCGTGAAATYRDLIAYGAGPHRL